MISALEHRLREVGRIRIGAQEGPRPIKLETFRFTSPNEASIDRAAEIWGGVPGPWIAAPSEGEQWEVTTEAAEIEVLVVPQDPAASQYYEWWKAGGIERRCDGRFELTTGGECICDTEGGDRRCDITTHLLVILPQLPDVGVWRITTHGYNAAVEIPATVRILMEVAGEEKAPAALLGIEARTRKVNRQTHNFAVPVLRLPHALQDLARITGEQNLGLPNNVPDRQVPAAGSEPVGEAEAIGQRDPSSRSADDPTGAPASSEGEAHTGEDETRLADPPSTPSETPGAAPPVEEETPGRVAVPAGGSSHPGNHVWVDSPTLAKHEVCATKGCLAVRRKNAA